MEYLSSSQNNNILFLDRSSSTVRPVSQLLQPVVNFDLPQISALEKMLLQDGLVFVVLGQEASALSTGSRPAGA